MSLQYVDWKTVGNYENRRTSGEILVACASTIHAKREIKLSVARIAVDFEE